MLKMHFLGPGEVVEDELRIDPPYSELITFIGGEVGHDVDWARGWIGDVRDALAGKKVDGIMGQAYDLTADREMATLTNDLFDPPVVVRIPTPLLLEALERWLAYLESRGFKSHE